MVGSAYFAYDSTDLDRPARQQLTDNARCIMARRAARVGISGMADPRGTTEYNLGLGDRRARVAADFVAAQGVDRSILRTVSLGEEYATGTNEESWARDRRAEFELQ